jgi:hypothetical protein
MMVTLSNPACSIDAAVNIHCKQDHIRAMAERCPAVAEIAYICTNDAGEVVIEAFTTLMGQQGENSTQVNISRG